MPRKTPKLVKPLVLTLNWVKEFIEQEICQEEYLHVQVVMDHKEKEWSQLVILN